MPEISVRTLISQFICYIQLKVMQLCDESYLHGVYNLQFLLKWGGDLTLEAAGFSAVELHWVLLRDLSNILSALTYIPEGKLNWTEVWETLS